MIKTREIRHIFTFLRGPKLDGHDNNILSGETWAPQGGIRTDELKSVKHEYAINRPNAFYVVVKLRMPLVVIFTINRTPHVLHAPISPSSQKVVQLIARIWLGP